MAQVGAVLILIRPENRGRLVYFMGIDRVRYRRPVVAGDQVRLEAEVVRMRSRMGSLRGRALVDGKLACQGDMTFALGERRSRAEAEGRRLAGAGAVEVRRLLAPRGRALDRRRPRRGERQARA